LQPRERFFLGENQKSELARKVVGGLPVAVILAGGLGTRLRAAYSAGPKSMAPVAGRPFLDYLLTWLQSQGVKEVILCVGYKRTRIQRYVGKGSKWGLRVKYSIEEELLGTGGAVKNAKRLVPGARLFVINGDTFLGVNLKEMMKFHQSRGALATLAAVKVADHRRYGSLKLDGRGRITAFLEKGEMDASNQSEDGKRPINGGVYVFERKLLNRIRAHGPVSLERDVFPQLVASKNKQIYGFIRSAYFMDIGVPGDLRRAQSELPERFRVNDTH
jgi:D-glycero-alpha-D-manno-heptose 1-phosphate guanylyltransferase